MVEASEILRVPISSMYKYLRLGTLRGFKVGKHWRLTEKGVEDFIQTGEQLSLDLKIGPQRGNRGIVQPDERPPRKKKTRKT